MITISLIRQTVTAPSILAAFVLISLGFLLVSATAVTAQGSAPGTPERPTGTAVFIGGVDLQWNDVTRADSYEVQLFKNGKWTDLPENVVDIAFYGAGAIISELDPSATLWFRVRARNSYGSSDWSDWNQMNSTSQYAEGRRPRPDNVVASGAPAINGTTQIGKVLRADTTGIEDENGLDRVQFRFQWVSVVGNADTDITGATDSTYTLFAADGGKTIKVRVAFTDRGGYAESLTSGETAKVATAPNSPATGAPAVTGTAQVGETLTADISGIDDADGLNNATFSYQWVSNDGISDTDITGAISSTYTLVAADEVNTIKVRVTFTDDAGNEEAVTSMATAAVESAPTQAESDGMSYITVAVTEDDSDLSNIVTNFTVTWSDSNDCSTDYNAYLNIEPTHPGHEAAGSQQHLGSAPPDGTQITKGINIGVEHSEFNVEVYCGTDGSGRLVSKVDIPWSDGRPKPGHLLFRASAECVECQPRPSYTRLQRLHYQLHYPGRRQRRDANNHHRNPQGRVLRRPIRNKW